MDWRNRDPDYSNVDDLHLDECRLLAKSRSDASIFDLGGCDLEETEIDLCRANDSRNSSSVFDRLRLDAAEDFQDTPLENRGTQTCGCPNCTENDESSRGITSQEISSMRLVVQSPEILIYQGVRHAPEDIARYWKKDSRMWLWKSVRLARRSMNKSPNSSPVLCSSKSSENLE